MNTKLPYIMEQIQLILDHVSLEAEHTRTVQRLYNTRLLLVVILCILYAFALVYGVSFYESRRFWLMVCMVGLIASVIITISWTKRQKEHLDTDFSMKKSMLPLRALEKVWPK